MDNSQKIDKQYGYTKNMNLNIKNMISVKQELNNRLLYLCPEIFFDGTKGGIKLMMVVEPSSEQINWSVYEGDHRKEFRSFEQACDYYIKAIGKNKC